MTDQILASLASTSPQSIQQLAATIEPRAVALSDEFSREKAARIRRLIRFELRRLKGLGKVQRVYGGMWAPDTAQRVPRKPKKQPRTKEVLPTALTACPVCRMRLAVRGGLCMVCAVAVSERRLAETLAPPVLDEIVKVYDGVEFVITFTGRLDRAEAESLLGPVSGLNSALSGFCRVSPGLRSYVG